MRVNRIWTIFVIGGALLGAACGGVDGGSTDDGGGPHPPERLARALTAIGEANTGHFASKTTGADGTPHTAWEGDYQLLPPAADLTVTRPSAPGGTVTTQVVTVRRDVWSRRLSADLDDACWVHYDVSVLFRNGLLVRNGDIYSPAPVAVAGLGLGVYSTYVDQVSGTSSSAPCCRWSTCPCPRPSASSATPTTGCRRRSPSTARSSSAGRCSSATP